MALAALAPDSDVVQAAYIVAFVLFIVGVRQGTHPTTAKRGNLIAAAGMAIAVAVTLSLDGIGNWGLIIGGLVVGAAVGSIASIRVQMTAMPQMVALYNGVGGGAVALIAWSEFRQQLHEIDLGVITQIPLEIFVPILFSMVVGSVSFWGSNIAFGKLQGLISTQPMKVPGQQVINALLLVGIVAACIYLGINNDDPSQGDLHRRADRRGDPRQPRGAADRRRRHAGRDLAAERLHGPLGRGRRLLARQRRADRRRHPGRLLGNDPDHGDGDRDEPLGRQRALRRLRRPRPRAGRGTGRSARTARSAPRTPRSRSPTPTRS